MPEMTKVSHLFANHISVLYLFSRSELVCRVKYGNSLPDIPFDPKFIAYPFEVSGKSSVLCKETTLDGNNLLVHVKRSFII